MEMMTAGKRARYGEAAARKMDYDAFVGGRLEGLKSGSKTPYSAADVKALVLSKGFKEGLKEIKGIAKEYGQGGAIDDARREKLANFAANVNAIIKNGTLFEELAGDKELRNSWPLVKFAVAAALPGDVKSGFDRIGEHLKPEERLDAADRAKVDGVVKQTFGLKVLQKKPLHAVFGKE
jgi:hypothetical protein